MITTKLLIARHGNTFAPGDIVRRVGTTDLPLVESGLQQGRTLGEYLKQQQLIPDIIFTSQLQRAKQTAEQIQAILHSNLSIQPLAIFNEIDYGPDENKPEAEVAARVGEDALKEWESKAKVPNGWNVNPQEIIKNWHAFAQEMQHDFTGKTILVVTSNGIARFAPYLTGDFAAFSTQQGIKIATGALCVFEKKSTAAYWECIRWNIKPAAEIAAV